MTIEYGQYIKSGHAIWIINGTPLKLEIKRMDEDKLKEAVSIIENNLPVGKSISDAYPLIGLRNLIKILNTCYLDLLLQSLDRAMFATVESGENFSINQFLMTELGFEEEDVKMLSRGKDTSFRDALLKAVFEGKFQGTNVHNRFKNKALLVDLCESIGINNVIRYCFDFCREEFEQYLKHHIQEYTKNRETVLYVPLIKKVFGKMIDFSAPTKPAVARIKQLVDIEYEHQCEYFVKTNLQSMDISTDYWSLFFIRGVTLNNVNFDFKDIKSPTLKREVKLYFRDKLSLKKEVSISIMNSLTKAVNFLSDNNSKLYYFADIDALDVNSLVQHLLNDVTSQFGKPLVPSTVRSILNECSAIVDFIMETPDIKSSYPVPSYNHFKSVTFHNLSNMYNTTDVIPDEVMDQISLYVHELKPMYQTMFKVFNGTGLRLKEVTMLEADCITPGSNELLYVPYKVLASRRKRSLSDRRMIYVSDEIRDALLQQIEESEALRKETESNYLFLVNASGRRTTVTRGGFNWALNKLIEKHDIRDLDGNLWSFGSRQTRKTVASNMIMNGASETEIMHQLGHLHSKTTRKHYEEVEKKKLAELNTEFFKTKFELKVGKDRLNLFSEEERKALYVDFKLSYREVEFGQCTKHASEGVCNKRSGKISCATCNKLCTGKKYISKWLQLLESQKRTVRELENVYEAEQIPVEDYQQFIEYKRELHLLNSYQDVVSNINNF